MIYIQYRLRHGTAFLNKYLVETDILTSFKEDRSSIVEVIKIQVHPPSSGPIVNVIFSNEAGLPPLPSYEWVCFHRGDSYRQEDGLMIDLGYRWHTPGGGYTNQYCSFKKDPQELLDQDKNWELVGRVRL